ncbi:ATP-binding protein [Pinisolibacter aquiterrae]|uniref:ATP-binding protein n=1 Tax=Pinisolibacter aquiterrae TaxID=2815579 RepID=UPI001C3CDC94|nr:ATP-binding protein [Pinisolibacter aquiterrae]MBV5263882.1 hypothetical protein [Pinisolibacter aquiterrae]MCC8234579.1 hypothetical protein [Pinisolibacter aquiterrae]
MALVRRGGNDIAAPPVRRHILARLAGLIGFVVVAFVMTVWVIERRTRDDEFSAAVHSVETLLAQKIDTSIGLMRATVAGLGTSEEIARAFRARDRAKLRTLAAPLFETLHRDHRITHLYFTGLDRVNFLRLHEPESHGDVIDRFTMKAAAETGRPSSGIELGAFGTLTLRSVTPWRHDGETIGLIELGEEIGPLLADTGLSLGVHLYALIRRGTTEPAPWRQGRRMPGQPASLVEVGDHVLVSQSPREVLAAERALFPDLLRDGSIRTVQSPDGPLSMATAPLADASGRVVGVLAIFADRSRAQATFTNWMILATLASLAAGAGVFFSFNRALAGVEAAYRRQHELERRLLTISDEHQRIVQLEKLSAMGTMVGEIAHQLNNPLVGVVNMAQLAERSIDKPDRVREMLGEIRKAGQNCSAFVKRMLDFTRVTRFDSRSTDLRTVADEALALFNQSIGRKVSVERDMPEAPAIAVVDPNLLGHAIFNLLTNAAQATGERGWVRISLAPATHADGRAGWRFTVEDDGPGISEDAMRRLFTPFFTTRKEGTGLGLAVVQHIVLLHEGEVGAANRRQGGAALALWLPEAVSAAPKAPDGTPA